MRLARLLLRGGLGVFLAGWSLSSVGCTHNYYYGNAVPVCGPTAMPATVTNGAVCEVPSQVGGGSVVAQGSGAGSTSVVGGSPVYSNAPAPRVVVSTPSSGSRFGRWQRANPDVGLPQTRVTGAYDDSTINR